LLKWLQVAVAVLVQ